ncbi:E3 ubiquitin-protein ligase TRIM33-like isoform X2 [Sycon ciliatum]|uniref:E3 ubiquitin-protein ligase TRIM33-like isoform X2 n=1 Tax=Sycon ciliatum TaxID=27933 RepID=UPI0031F5F515
MSSPEWLCSGCGSSSTSLKYISCLHTLCAPCVQNSVSFDGSIKCPKCWSTTPLPMSVEPLRSLPSVVSLGDAGYSVAGEDTQTTPVCEECGTRTTATSSCENCHVRMCDVHAAGHQLFKANQGHIVKPLSQVKRASSSAGSTSRSAATQHRCVLHTSEFVDGFCVQCNQLLCPKCKQAHSLKKDHQVLDIASAGQKTRDTLADKLGSSTSTCDGVTSQALYNVQTNIEKLNNQTEQASAKVTEFSKLLVEAAEKRQNELLAELDDLRYKKILSLEKQRSRLQECLSQEETAAHIVKSFADDVDLLHIWTWVDESLNKAMRTAEEDTVPCVSSGLVFASTDITQLLNDIGKSGTVLDVADHAVLNCPEDVTTHDDVTLTVEVMSSPTDDAVTESATSISSAVRRITIPVCSVSRDQLDSVGLEISVRNLDDDGEFHPVRTRFESLPGCVEMGFDRLQAGTYSVSATIGCRHLQGSPQQLLVKSTEADRRQHNTACEVNQPEQMQHQQPYQQEWQRPYQQEREQPYQQERQQPYQQEREQPYQQKREQPYQQKRQQPYQQEREQPYQQEREQPYRQERQQPYQQKREQPYQQERQQPYQQEREQPYQQERQQPYQQEREQPYQQKREQPYQQ